MAKPSAGMRHWVLAAWLLASLPLAGAQSDLEQRALALEEQLRCLVCQNQSIADSHAGLAADLRREVREQLAQGKSEQQVLDFMVQRYGDFVLYRPPVQRSTWLLWFGPALLLAAALALLAGRLRALRQARPASAADLQRARALLAGQQEQP